MRFIFRKTFPKKKKRPQMIEKINGSSPKKKRQVKIKYKEKDKDIKVDAKGKPKKIKMFVSYRFNKNE